MKGKMILISDGFTSMICVFLMTIFALMFCNCNGSQPYTPSSSRGSSSTPVQPPAERHPDLTISTIEVLPGQPTSGTRFALIVYVKNIGNAGSGDYDIAISIKDVSRGETYPVGTFRNSGLQPGENVTAYSSTDRMVNNPGAYQVHAEIKPFLFTDGNTQNNVKIWAFTVN